MKTNNCLTRKLTKWHFAILFFLRGIFINNDDYDDDDDMMMMMIIMNFHSSFYKTIGSYACMITCRCTLKHEAIVNSKNYRSKKNETWMTQTCQSLSALCCKLKGRERQLFIKIQVQLTSATICSAF